MITQHFGKSSLIKYTLIIILQLQALMNAVVDCLGVYKTCVSARSGEMIAPISLKHLPLYIVSLLKQVRCMSFEITAGLGQVNRETQMTTRLHNT